MSANRKKRDEILIEKEDDDILDNIDNDDDNDVVVEKSSKTVKRGKSSKTEKVKSETSDDDEMSPKIDKSEKLDKVEKHEKTDKFERIDKVSLRSQRIGVFVDNQNLFYSATRIFNKYLDYKKLLEFIVRDRQLIRALAYVVESEETRQGHFINILKRHNYEIRSKNLKRRPDGTAKGDWDMGIAIDSMSLAVKLDVVALVSGDGDFLPLINKLKALGCRVELYYIKGSCADEIIEAADDAYLIEKTLCLETN